MYSASLTRFMILPAILLFAMLGLAGCDGITDDLLPSGEDKRQDADPGTMGPNVGQIADDFTLQDTLDVSRGLYNELSSTGVTGVVLYFNMWCPICDAHASHMRAEIMPNFPNVSFFLVDYVSGSVANSRAAQLAYGYANMETLVDSDQSVFNYFKASMGTTVVVSSTGNIVMMNEDYKDGVKLTETLQALP